MAKFSSNCSIGFEFSNFVTFYNSFFQSDFGWYRRCVHNQTPPYSGCMQKPLTGTVKVKCDDTSRKPWDVMHILLTFMIIAMEFYILKVKSRQYHFSFKGSGKKIEFFTFGSRPLLPPKSGKFLCIFFLKLDHILSTIFPLWKDQTQNFQESEKIVFLSSNFSLVTYYVGCRHFIFYFVLNTTLIILCVIFWFWQVFIV